MSVNELSLEVKKKVENIETVEAPIDPVVKKFQNSLECDDKNIKFLEIINLHYEAIQKRIYEGAQNKDLILFHGITGVGKSTLINYLRGFDFYITKIERALYKAELDPLSSFNKHHLNLELAEASPSENSVTYQSKVYPVQFKEEILNLTDCPGFNPARPETDKPIKIFESLSTEILVKNAASIRAIVLVINPDFMSREGGFATYFELVLTKYLTENVKNCPIAIVYTYKEATRLGNNTDDKDAVEREIKANKDKLYEKVNGYLNNNILPGLLKAEQELKDMLDKYQSILEKEKASGLGWLVKNTVGRLMNTVLSPSKSKPDKKEGFELQEKIKTEHLSVEKYKRQKILLELMKSPENTFFSDITKPESRTKILEFLAKQKNKKGNGKDLNFSSYNSERTEFDRELPKKLDLMSKILKDHLELPKILQIKNNELARSKSTKDNYGRLLERLNQEPKASVESSMELKNQLEHQVKIYVCGKTESEYNIKKFKAKLEELKLLKEKNDPDKVICIKEYGPTIEKRGEQGHFGIGIPGFRAFDKGVEALVGYSYWPIEHNMPGYPICKIGHNLGNGYIYDEDDSECHLGKYRMTYYSGRGKDGYCEVKLYSRQGDIESFKQDLMRINREIETLEADLIKEENALQDAKLGADNVGRDLANIQKLIHTTKTEKDQKRANFEAKISKEMDKIVSLEQECSDLKTKCDIAYKIVNDPKCKRLFSGVADLVSKLKPTQILSLSQEQHYLELFQEYQGKSNKPIMIQFSSNVEIKQNELYTEQLPIPNSPQTLEYKEGQNCEYGNKDDIKQNYEKALMHYEKAANNKDMNALYKCGLFYLQGKGTKRNPAQAREVWTKAFNQDAPHPLAYYQMGFLNFVEGKDKLSDECFEQAFLLLHNYPNNSNCLYYLGQCYEKGLGTAQSSLKAFECYEKAATLAQPLACYSMANCYEFAMGVEKNDRLANIWYLKAFDLLHKISYQGDPEVLYTLGICYLKGKGVSRNDKLAVECFKKSKSWNFGRAHYELSICYLTGKGIAYNADEAAKEYKEYCDKSGAIRIQTLNKDLQPDPKTLNDILSSSDSEKLKEYANSSRNRNLIVTLAQGTKMGIRFAKNLAYLIIANQNILRINLHDATLEPGCLDILIRALSINSSIVAFDISKIKGVELDNVRENQIIQALNLNVEGIKAKFPIDQILSSPILYSFFRDILLSNQDNQPLVEHLQNIHFDKAQVELLNSTKLPFTFMHIAALLNFPELIEALCKANIGFRKLDLYGRSPLEYAAAFGHIDAVATLLELGAVDHGDNLSTRRVIYRSLELAVIGDHTNVVTLLLLHPYAKAVLINPDNGNTLLHTAAQYNSVRTLSMLLNHPQMSTMDPNQKNKEGLSPIHLASKFGREEISKILLGQGIDIELLTSEPKSAKNKSPLDIAVDHEQIELIKFLIVKGAVITAHCRKIAASNQSIKNALEIPEALRHKLETQDKKSQNENLMHIENFVFEGGGVKGLGHIGALLKLYKDMPSLFAQLKRVAGTSAGAIIAFLLSIGNDPKEMEVIVRGVNFKEIMDGPEQEFINKIVEIANEGASLDKIVATTVEPLKFAFKQGGKAVENIANARGNYQKGFYLACAKDIVVSSARAIVAGNEIYEHYSTITKLFSDMKGIYDKATGEFGIFPGTKIIDLFKQWLRAKSLPEDLTFSELHELRKKDPAKYKDLYIVVTNLSKGRPEVFSHESAAKSVLIMDAVRASMAIPFFFKPIQIRCKNDKKEIVPFSSDTYVDGGILMNLPIRLFDRRRYLEPEDLINPFNEAMFVNDAEVYNNRVLGFSVISTKESEYINSSIINPERSKPIKGITEYLSQLLMLYINSEKVMHVASTDSKRTVYINSLGMSTVDFALNDIKQESLLSSGLVGIINFYDRTEIQTNQKKISKDIVSWLIKHSVYRQFIKLSGGYNIDQIKLSITTPADLIEILMVERSPEELSFIASLPIDVTITDHFNRNILHLAIERYRRGETSTMLTVVKNVKHWSNYFDFTARDDENRSIGDYLFDGECKSLFEELYKLILDDELISLAANHVGEYYDQVVRKRNGIKPIPTHGSDHIPKSTQINLSKDGENKSIQELSAFTLETVGQGNCAFHSVFGTWNGNIVECKDHVDKRNTLALAIRNVKEGDSIFPLVVQAIQEMLMGGSNRFQTLKAEYQQYILQNSKYIEESWKILEVELKKYQNILDFIRTNTQDKMEHSDLKSQFHYCLNLEDGILYGLIFSVIALRNQFEVYNKEANRDFDLANRILNDKSIIDEYANYINRSNQWLLPLELKIMALVFNINIRYCSYNPYLKTRTELENLKPNADISVGVCFDGRRHFERINEKSVQVNAKVAEIPLKFSKDRTPSLKESSTIATSINKNGR